MSSEEDHESHIIEHLHSIEIMGGFTIFFLIVIMFSIGYLYYRIKLMNAVSEVPLMHIQEENLDFGNIHEQQDPEIGDHA